MHDIEADFAEFRRLGAYERDWTAWGNLFTDDALYVDHASQIRLRGGREFAAHVHSAMAAVAPMTFSIDWWIVDGGWVAMYIWNHLPDPAGAGERFGFPNITLLHFDGDGRCDVEEDFYNPADAAAVVTRWYVAGGLAEQEPDRSLTGHEGHAPDLSQIVVSRSELEVEFARFCARTRQAVASGDWVSWAQQFTSRASIHDHGVGRFAGRTAIGEAASRMAHAIVRRRGRGSTLVM